MSDAISPEWYSSHPAKCQCGRAIEMSDVAGGFGFRMGCALKYIWRADLKGKPIEDIQKAIWYLQKELEVRKEELVDNPKPPTLLPICRNCCAQIFFDGCCSECGVYQR